MARNKLSDLNDILFAQLDRLNDENIKPEDLELEIKRANSISSLSAQVINNAKIVLDAAKLSADTGKSYIPEQFGLNQNNK